MRNKRMILILAVLLVFSLTHYADRVSDDYLDKALKNAAVTFAVARVLNGMISLVQHMEVAGTPAGVGLSVAPGQILDPLNDLVEQFSTVMLMATVSLAIQKLLLAFSGSWLAKVFIGALLFLVLIIFVLDHFKILARVNKNLLYKTVLLVLFIRFVIPFVAISSGIFESQFLREPIQSKTEKLQLLEQAAAGFIGPDDEQRWYSSLLKSGKSLLSVRENALLLKEKMSKSINTIIELIALFIIQTVLLPLAFLYFAVRIIRHLMSHDFSVPGHLKIQ